MPNIADKLEKLAELRDRGALTDAEFAEQKARLLRPDAGGALPQGGGSPASPPPEPTQGTPHAPPPPPPVAATSVNPKYLIGGALAVAGALAAVHALSGRPGSSSPSPGTTVSSAPEAAGPASGAPTEEDVKRVLLAARSGQPQFYRFNAIRISAPQPVTLAEQSSYEAPPGGTWYLVRVDYVWDASSSAWNDPQAYIHDVVGSYAMFRNQLGEWTMSGDAQPGDKDVLRGGYSN